MFALSFLIIALALCTFLDISSFTIISLCHAMSVVGQKLQPWQRRAIQHEMNTLGSEQQHFENERTLLTSNSDDTQSGFLKLSAEIRNQIYCLTLVTNFVIIQDLHPEEWQAEEEAGHAIRTSYKTKDHTQTGCSYTFKNGKICTLYSEQWSNPKVSYTLGRHFLIMAPTIGMLALNRQTRAEAVPVFYGRNTILFDSMSAVLPFVEDRSELSLQSMHHFHLEMELERVKYQKRRSDGWARVFAGLSKIKALNLRKLTVCLNDPECRYAWKLKLDIKLQRWVHEMANITNLDMLGVMDFSIMGELTPNEGVKDESPTEELLWEFLASKMLKKVEDEPHDAHSLLKRRIRYGEGQDAFSDSDVRFFGQSAD